MKGKKRMQGLATFHAISTRATTKYKISKIPIYTVIVYMGIFRFR